MTNPIDIVPGKSQRKGWVPSDTYSMVPTLVLLCGNMAGEANTFQERINRRLSIDFPLYALQWAHIQDISNVSEAKILRCVAPLLNRNLWLRLLDDDYRKDIPAEEQFLTLRIIVVYNLAGHPEDSLKSNLEKLATTIRFALSRRAEVSLQLIVLGEGDLELKDQTPDGYWPRFKLGTAMLGGGIGSPPELLEGCETLIAALLTSELADAIDSLVSTEAYPPNWIAIGASAIIADLSLMREYLWLETYNGLVNPLVSRGKAEDGTLLLSTDIPADEKGFLDKTAAAVVGNSMGVIRACADHIADVTSLYPEGIIQPSEMALDIRSSLEMAPFLLRPRFVDEPDSLFTPRLTKQLLSHYQNVIDTLAFVSPTVSEEFVVPQNQPREQDQEEASEPPGQSKGHFEAESDNLSTSLPIVVAKESRKLLDWSCELLEDMQDRSLAGLPVVVYTTKRMVHCLETLPEIIRWPGERYRVGISTGAAYTDAATISGLARRYRRHINSLLGVFATILVLIPAVPFVRDTLLGSLPVIRGLLGINLPNGLSDEQLSTWIGLGLLAACALIDQAVMRLNARRRLREYQEDWQELVSTTERNLKGAVLENHRLSLIAQIGFLIRPLEWLLHRLTEQAEDVSARLEQIEKAQDGATNRETSICRLVDLGQPWNWALKAVEEANQGEAFTKFTTSTIADYMTQLLQRNEHAELRSHISVIRRIEGEVNQQTEKYFENEPVYFLSVLVDQNPRLQQGKLWTWLYQRAWPFGTGSRSFAVILVESGEAPLHLPGGDEADKRDSSWSIVHTGLRHEVVCIRGVY